MSKLYGRWRFDPHYWLEAEYRVRRQAFGSWGRSGEYFMGAPHQALLMASGAATDPYYSSTVLIVNPSGANGSTTAPIDQSPVGRTLTMVGNTQYDTSITKFTSSSLKFDGTGDNITSPHTSDLGSVSETLEVWAYPTVVNELNFIIATRNESGFGPCWYMYMTAAGKIAFVTENITGITMTSTNAISVNTWVFLQVLSNSPTNSSSLYIDANPTVEAQAIMTCNPQTGNGLLRIGSSSNEDGTRDWKGNLGPIRITNGVIRAVALPTAAFPTS